MTRPAANASRGLPKPEAGPTKGTARLRRTISCRFMAKVSEHRANRPVGVGNAVPTHTCPLPLCSEHALSLFPVTVCRLEAAMSRRLEF